MKLLIDADGCPVVELTIQLAEKYGVECVLLCDTAHVFDRKDVQVLTFSKGKDSVDFALVNMVTAGDIVVTQDYGLAAMCLARRAVVLSQNGLIYTDANIDSLLEQRYISQKVRKAGGRMKGPPKRTGEQDIKYQNALEGLLKNKQIDVK